MVKATIVTGLQHGDEGKGKIVNSLVPEFDYVCRYQGGPNAGHTVYINGVKYVTHGMPSGALLGVRSYIGPGCVLDVHKFLAELASLPVDPSLIKIHPNCHIIQPEHILQDSNTGSTLGTTKSGIGPCYAAKAERLHALRACQVPELADFVEEIKLEGTVLCEGAQGIWLDPDHGNYPYVTSSSTLPTAACTLGFSYNDIEQVIGVAKAYDTRVGEDPDFPEPRDSLLTKLAELGNEFGATTGRPRRCRWLDLDRLIAAIRLSGADTVIINKVDVLEQLGHFRYTHNGKLIACEHLTNWKLSVEYIIRSNCPHVLVMHFSDNPYDL